MPVNMKRADGWKLAPPELVNQLGEIHACDWQSGGAMRLIPRRQRRALNAGPLELGETPGLLIHPEDAVRLGIADGAMVRVATATGEVRAPAKLDVAIRPGTVSLPHGHRDANVNVLTDSARADPLTGMALYGGFEVEVEPV